jgi:serine/threonine protein phosphatase 1
MKSETNIEFMLRGVNVIRALVISDIHGCIEQFNDLLKLVKYDSNEDNLILIGDYVDRGFYSKEVLDQVIGLYTECNIIALKGNHDQMMLDAFNRDADSLWLNNGGYQTVESYVGNDFFDGGFDWDRYIEAKEFIKTNFPHHLEFLSKLPLYYEDEKHIYVHAGLNPMYEDWKTQQPTDDFLWIREMFFNNKTSVEKNVVFGHTPTPYLHREDKNADIWIGEDKIGIDGACAYGYQLNCLEINEEGYKTYSVSRRSNV